MVTTERRAAVEVEGTGEDIDDSWKARRRRVKATRKEVAGANPSSYQSLYRISPALPTGVQTPAYSSPLTLGPRNTASMTTSMTCVLIVLVMYSLTTPPGIRCYRYDW